jgi:hypothetical protein
MNPIHEVHQEAKPATWRPVMLHPDEREETALPKRCGQIGGPFSKVARVGGGDQETMRDVIVARTQ